MRILFTGGGTLGSVTPLLAVAEEFPKKKPEVFFWGTRRGPERALVESAGIPFRAIPAGKLRRYWDVRNISDIFVIAWAFAIAFVRFLHGRPSVVVGAGSFVQVPVVWAAWVLRIPILIHQLDIIPGLANRLAARCATRMTATFPERATTVQPAYPVVHGRMTLGPSEPRRLVEVVGCPVRRAVWEARGWDARAAKQRFGFSGDRPVLLVLGGGTGAEAINAFVRGSLLTITERTDVIHVTGEGKDVGHPSPAHRHTSYRQFNLLTDDLPYAYAAADLVVSRAGMGTLSELGALGKPTALIPMPDTHQEENAAALRDRGAVVVWDQRALNPAAFARRVGETLADEAQLVELRRRFTVVFPAAAAERMAEIIAEVAAGA